MQPQETSAAIWSPATPRISPAHGRTSACLTRGDFCQGAPSSVSLAYMIAGHDWLAVGLGICQLLTVKRIITLFIFLALVGFGGFLYAQNNISEKSKALAAQQKELSDQLLELKVLKTELGSVKSDAAAIRENNVAFKEEMQRLKMESAQQEIIERHKQSAMRNEAAKIQAANLKLQNESKQIKEDTIEREFVQQRNQCILNQRNLQQAVRGYQNINGLSVGAPLDLVALTQSGQYLAKMPECACGVPYTLSRTIPPIGKLAATCGYVGRGGRHLPEKHSDW
jgi:hypothetical protein